MKRRLSTTLKMEQQTTAITTTILIDIKRKTLKWHNKNGNE